MTEKNKSFWATIPGILTGVAAVISAITGLYLALYRDTKPPQGIPQPPAVVNSCEELRHQLHVKQEHLDMARQDLAHIQNAASAGDRDAQRALPQRRQFVQGLEREIGDLSERIRGACDSR